MYCTVLSRHAERQPESALGRDGTCTSSQTDREPPVEQRQSAEQKQKRRPETAEPEYIEKSQKEESENSKVQSGTDQSRTEQS